MIKDIKFDLILPYHCKVILFCNISKDRSYQFLLSYHLVEEKIASREKEMNYWMIEKSYNLRWSSRRNHFHRLHLTEIKQINQEKTENDRKNQFFATLAKKNKLFNWLLCFRFSWFLENLSDLICHTVFPIDHYDYHIKRNVCLREIINHWSDVSEIKCLKCFTIIDNNKFIKSSLKIFIKNNND